MNEVLKKLRKEIDQIDSAILNLLSRRAKTAKKTAKIKSNSKNKNIFRPEREPQIITNILKFNKGHLTDEHLSIIYKYYKDKIVDLYLEKKINSPKPKLIKIR